MCRSIIKIAQVAALVAGGLGAMNAMAADGQIRITGEVINKTCEVAINGAPSSTLLNLDPVAVADLTQTVKSAKGTSLKASKDVRTINITLEKCDPGKTWRSALTPRGMLMLAPAPIPTPCCNL